MKQLRVLTSYTPTAILTNELARKCHNITEFRIILNCMAEYELLKPPLPSTSSSSSSSIEGATIYDFQIFDSVNKKLRLHQIDLIFCSSKKFKCIQK